MELITIVVTVLMGITIKIIGEYLRSRRKKMVKMVTKFGINLELRVKINIFTDLK